MNMLRSLVGNGNANGPDSGEVSTGYESLLSFRIDCGDVKAPID